MRGTQGLKRKSQLTQSARARFLVFQPSPPPSTLSQQDPESCAHSQAPLPARRAPREHTFLEPSLTSTLSYTLSRTVTAMFPRSSSVMLFTGRKDEARRRLDLWHFPWG